MKASRVADVMTKDVVSVTEDTQFAEIVAIISERRINAVPVVDEQGRLIGIITEADLLRKEQFSGLGDEPKPIFERPSHRQARAKAEATTASGLLSAQVVTVGPEASAVAAARLLADRKFKQLPVIDEDRQLVGMVARSDLLRLYLRADADILRDVVDEVLLRSLWQDPEQVNVVVDGGVVWLSGTMETKSLIPLAVRLTAGIEGVVDVIDDLTYVQDDTRAKPHPHR
jgi:CBS-domain-containing membrane protein